MEIGLPREPVSARERELESRLAAAEARLIQTAVKLLKKADDTDMIRRVVCEAAGEVAPSNGDSPVHDIVPFWGELTSSQKHRVGGILKDD